MSREQILINEEREFVFRELFFSTTDKSGKITSWNEVFQRISGYANEELINKPHSLIRHPDMPRGVFQLLWDMIESNQEVGAYVKNRAIDGRYYWVYALVLPFGEGYLSIRLKPSSPFFEVVKGLYPSLLAYEHELDLAGVRKADIARKSKEKLLQALEELGFENYREFMKVTLPAEILGREEVIKQQKVSEEEVSTRTVAEINRYMQSKEYQRMNDLTKFSYDLDELFNDLSRSLGLSKVIKNSFKETNGLVQEIKRGALNATIEATRLGVHGESLYVLADYLGYNGRKTIAELAFAEKACTSSLSSVADILFVVCVAKLQTETLTSFLKELINDGGESSSIMSFDRIGLLIRTFYESISAMTTQYDGLEAAFSSMLKGLEELRLLFISLKIAHISAKTEASRVEAAGRFGQVFDEVCSVVDHGRSFLDVATLQLENYVYTLRSRKDLCTSLKASADKIEESSHSS